MIENIDGDGNVTGYRLAANVEPYDITEAIRIIEDISQPATKKDIIQALTKLHLKTKQKRQEASDTAMQLQVYAEELAEYPADVVIETLKKWPNHSPWWPSWKELKGELDWRNNRVLMLRELKKSTSYSPSGRDIPAVIKSAIRKF